MQCYVGTSGYSYKEWKGVFYPPDLPDKEMLPFYSSRLPAVEINQTFYRLPSPGQMTSWAEKVPPEFRFVIKASRKITHRRPLLDKADAVDYLLRTAAMLGDRLGAILFQLPPYLHKDIALLDAFTALLPAGIPTVFEFRHRSWFDEDLYALLRSKGCALCYAESEKGEAGPLAATADWGYLRLRKPHYAEADLRAWLRKIQSLDWKAVFVFFKHEDGALGPRMAGDFLEMARNGAITR